MQSKQTGVSYIQEQDGIVYEAVWNKIDWERLIIQTKQNGKNVTLIMHNHEGMHLSLVSEKANNPVMARYFRQKRIVAPAGSFLEEFIEKTVNDHHAHKDDGMPVNLSHKEIPLEIWPKLPYMDAQIVFRKPTYTKDGKCVAHFNNAGNTSRHFANAMRAICSKVKTQAMKNTAPEPNAQAHA